MAKVRDYKFRSIWAEATCRAGVKVMLIQRASTGLCLLYTNSQRSLKDFFPFVPRAKDAVVSNSHCVPVSSRRPLRFRSLQLDNSSSWRSTMCVSFRMSVNIVRPPKISRCIRKECNSMLPPWQVRAATARNAVPENIKRSPNTFFSCLLYPP